MSPRLDESAGRRRSTRQRPGSRWLKPLLIQAAWAAIRCKQSYFRAQYYRLRARRGAKKAIGAVAASLLTTIYHLLHSPTLTVSTISAPTTSTNSIPRARSVV